MKTLYHKPQAKVITHGITSTPITLQRSSRQGCPLSAGLFVLALEPLAQAVRQDPDIKGVQVGQLNHKMSLFADDVILFLTDPTQSLTKLITLLNNYSTISGYKVNYEKSEMLPLTKADWSKLSQTNSFKWSPNGFTYLGIQVDSDLKNLFKLNYPQMIQKIESDLSRWADLPLTLIGRINCIKMNILPKIMFLFQSLSIPLPNSIFKTLNKSISAFIWNHKVPRMSLEKLSWDYGMGGLRLHNFIFYYWAAQIRSLLHFFEQDSAPSWTKIKLHVFEEDMISDFVYKWNTNNIGTKTKNPLTIHSIRSWFEVHKIIEMKIDLSPKTPLWKNNLIPMFSDNKIFKLWHNKGIVYFEQCYNNKTLLSFEQLKAKYDLSNNTFYN